MRFHRLMIKNFGNIELFNCSFDQDRNVIVADEKTLLTIYCAMFDLLNRQRWLPYRRTKDIVDLNGDIGLSLTYTNERWLFRMYGENGEFHTSSRTNDSQRPAIYEHPWREYVDCFDPYNRIKTKHPHPIPDDSKRETVLYNYLDFLHDAKFSPTASSPPYLIFRPPEEKVFIINDVFSLYPEEGMTDYLLMETERPQQTIILYDIDNYTDEIGNLFANNDYKIIKA